MLSPICKPLVVVAGITLLIIGGKDALDKLSDKIYQFDTEKHQLKRIEMLDDNCYFDTNQPFIWKDRIYHHSSIKKLVTVEMKSLYGLIEDDN